MDYDTRPARRRKSPNARRLQARRAEGRTLLRCIRSMDTIAGQGGNRVGKLGDALQQALRSHSDQHWVVRAQDGPSSHRARAQPVCSQPCGSVLRASAPAFVPAASRPQASAQSSVSVEAQKMIVPSGLSCAAPLAVSGRDHQAVALVQPSTAKAALHPFRRPVPLANRQVQPVSSCRFSIQKHNANACWHGVRRRFLQSVGSSDLEHFSRNGADFLVVFVFDVLPVGVH